MPRSAKDIKKELLEQTPAAAHPLVEELDAARRFAWSRYFRLEEKLTGKTKEKK
jgi:hypothetical protein